MKDAAEIAVKRREGGKLQVEVLARGLPPGIREHVELILSTWKAKSDELGETMRRHKAIHASDD